MKAQTQIRILSCAQCIQHICIVTGQIVTDCVGVERGVINIVNCWISEQILASPKVITSQISSARIIKHIWYCAQYGKNNWRGSKAHNNTKKCMDPMGNQYSSNGQYSQDTPRCRSSEISKSEWENLNCTPENFSGRIKCMSMCNDMIWRIKENELTCLKNSEMVSEYARSFALGRWSFLRAWFRKEV